MEIGKVYSNPYAKAFKPQVTEDNPVQKESSESSSYEPVVDILKTLHNFSGKIQFKILDVNGYYNIAYDDPNQITKNSLTALKNSKFWNTEFAPTTARFDNTRVNIHFQKTAQQILNIKDFDKKNWTPKKIKETVNETIPSTMKLKKNTYRDYDTLELSPNNSVQFKKDGNNYLVRWVTTHNYRDQDLFNIGLKGMSDSRYAGVYNYYKDGNQSDLKLNKSQFEKILSIIDKNWKSYAKSFADFYRNRHMVDNVNESNIKYAKTITKKEWNKVHNDYKTIRNGVHYMLINDPKHGTVSAPVKVVESVSNITGMIPERVLNEEKWRAEVTGIGEDKWSSNSMEYPSEQDAKKYLDKLSSRWFGYDLGRVVPSSTPKGQKVDTKSQNIHQNFRKK